MADDSHSASQLRQRYGRGGTATDSELSASQLRARYDIDNSRFSKYCRPSYVLTCGRWLMSDWTLLLMWQARAA
eukprot:55634-Eustigmatos_ZCMA.PRE.1